VCFFDSVTRDRPLYRPPSLQSTLVIVSENWSGLVNNNQVLVYLYRGENSVQNFFKSVPRSDFWLAWVQRKSVVTKHNFKILSASSGRNECVKLERAMLYGLFVYFGYIKREGAFQLRGLELDLKTYIIFLCFNIYFNKPVSIHPERIGSETSKKSEVSQKCQSWIKQRG
jgi:hypothetical protein